MPIVFVHGVAVRTQAAFPGIKEMLWQYVAPKIAPQGRARDVTIYTPYWAPFGATFAWNRASLPGNVVRERAPVAPSPAPERAIMLSGEQLALAATPSVQRGLRARQQPPVLATVAQLSELLSGIAAAQVLFDPSAAFDAQTARAAIALDAAAHEFVPGGATEITPEFLDKIGARANEIYSQDGVAQRAGSPIGAVISGAKQIVGAVEDGAGDLLSILVLKYRPQINEGLTNFFGDVFVYMAKRGDAGTPGPIVKTILDALLSAVNGPKVTPDEPLVILSHSMGGQIVYDLITYFMDGIPELKHASIKLWAAAASQVGLFEEMKLFKVSDPRYSAANHNKAPFPPARLDRWYNVWDPDDILSYTAAPIFQVPPGSNRFVDRPFSSHLSVFKAHGGYLVSPAFYQAMAKML